MKKKDKILGGNIENKYETKNPISRILMNNFLANFKELLAGVDNPSSILEIGCGEGYLTEIVAKKFFKSKIVAGDYYVDVLEIAKKKLKKYNNVTCVRLDAEKLDFMFKSFDLIICCEVLEHLSNPAKATKEINKVLRSGAKAIVSVPREPVWRILNMLRFKYLSDFGNTPGHLNHWSKNRFVNFLKSNGLVVESVLLPFPWIICSISSK